MRLNVDTNINFLITVYLDGKKESDAIEVYIPGNTLKGQGYIVRHARHNGRLASALDVNPDNLPPNHYIRDHSLYEKVEGNVRIEIADDRSLFEES